MAKLYCDNTLYSTTLEWGIAQEGDGTAKTKAVPATVSINLAGISAVNGNTLAVAGRVVTVTGPYSEGALADHIASLINASSGTVTAAATNWPTPQLRDFAYARGPSNGAPANTLQIMTRAGSATYNANALCAVVSSGFTGGSVNERFSGGAGGAFAYSIRCGVGLFPSHASTTHYGIFFSGSRIAGAITAGDVVIVRPGETTTKRIDSGNATIGIANASVLFDNETEWPEDAGMNKVTNLVFFNANNASASLFVSAGSSIIGHRYASGALNFRMSVTGFQTFNYLFTFENIFAVKTRWQSIELDLSGASPSSTQHVFLFSRTSHSSAEESPTFVDCDFWLHQNGSPLANLGGNYNTYATFDGGNVGYKPGKVPSTATNFLQTGQSAAWVAMTFKGVVFHNFVSGSQVLSATSHSSATLTAQDCILDNVDITHVFGSPTSAFSSIGNREFFYRPAPSVGFSQWKAAQGYPTLNAILPDLTPWSIMATTATSGMSESNVLELPRLVKEYSDFDGKVEVKVEFLFDKAGSVPVKNRVWCEIDYMDSEGIYRHESTFGAAGEPCDLSSSTWTPEASGDPFLGALIFAKYKISFVTRWAVKTGTAVSLTFYIGQNQSTSLQRWIIDPDVSIIRVGP